MKYALLNNERIEPQKGILNAVCPICGEKVLPKCGNIKMHHWAHKSNKNCDPWWENETHWHRKWKDNFPKDCQEIIMLNDDTKEKHVADVKTKTGIIIEFQHSNISPEEQISREQFYKNMIWVIDAKKYYDKFKKNINLLSHSKINKNYFYTHLNNFEKSKNCFPEKWLNSTVPVILDFGCYDDTNELYEKQKKWLWCIFPEKYTKYLNYKFYNETICGVYLKKDTFINAVSYYNKFYKNIVLQELEDLWNIQEQKRLRQEKLFQQDQEKQKELVKKAQQEKYINEERWRYAIFQTKKCIENKKINPLALYITNNGKIIDTNKNEYNNKKYMILGVKSYSAKYKETSYTRNDLLLLIEKNNDEIITAKIHVHKYILYGGGDFDIFNGILNGNYNYYIRRMSVIPNYDKFTLWSEDEERIWTTDKIKKDLKFICENVNCI